MGPFTVCGAIDPATTIQRLDPEMSTWNRKTHPYRIVRTFVHPRLRWVNHTETFETWALARAAAVALMTPGCYEVSVDVTTDAPDGSQGPWRLLATRKIKKPLKLTPAGRAEDAKVAPGV